MSAAAMELVKEFECIQHFRLESPHIQYAITARMQASGVLQA